MILSLLSFLKWQLKGQPFSSSYFILALPGPPGSPRHVSYLQLLIARARHTAFNVHMKIWESHSCLYQQFCLCAMFRARLIFQVGDVRLSFLPVYIMFVILIYRVKKKLHLFTGRNSCCSGEWELVTGSASPSWISWFDLDFFAELQYASKWATK